MTRLLLLALLTVLFTGPAGAAEEKGYLQYTEPVKEATQEFLVKYYERLKIIGLLQMCNETEVLGQLYEQNKTGADIEQHFRDKEKYPGLTEEWIHINTALVASFLAGFSVGHKVNTESGIKSDKQKKKICFEAIEQGNAELYGEE